MPYTIRKQKCTQSDGDKGSYVLSYTDKKGKKHRNCHTSRKKARGQIAAIEAEAVEGNVVKMKLSELRQIIRETIEEIEHGHESDDMDEAKDQDGDGDNDFADVTMARYMAGGMSKKDALKKSRKFDDK